MDRCQQLGRERLETILKHCLPPLNSAEDQKLLKSGQCFDTAQGINSVIDWLILLGRADLANEYAIWGERLIRLSIEQNEWPAGMNRQTYPSCLIRWRQYDHLHGLSWMVEGRDCEEHLGFAMKAAREFMDQLYSQRRPRYLSEYTLAYVWSAGKLGLFNEAKDAVMLLKERGAKRKKRVTPILPGVSEFFRDVKIAAASAERESRKVSGLNALLETIGIEEHGQYAASEIGEIEEFWLCYVACKFIPKYAQDKFTRENIQRPMVHLLPEMLGAKK